MLIILLSRLFNVNVKAVFNLTQAVAKRMVEAQIKGSIVNISSQASKLSKSNVPFCSKTYL